MGVVTATVLSDGQEMASVYQLLAVDVSKEVNRIPTAELRLLDGSAAEQRFALSDEAFFEPGKEIEIKLRYEGERDTSIFKGVVIRHAVEAGRGGSSLTVELKDAAVKLTRPRRSAVFTDQTDADVIGHVLDGAGIKKGSIGATKPQHAEIVQYHCSDWDFILSRADAYGLLVVVEAGELSVKAIDLSPPPKHTLEFGLTEIYDFEMEVDGSHQTEAIESVGWSPKDQKSTPSNKAKSFALSQGNLSGDDIARRLGFGTMTLSHPVPIDRAELESWADGRMARERMAMIRGRIAVSGVGDIGLLDVIEIGGVGKRFNGKTLVTGVRHRVTLDGWVTDLQFGLEPDWYCRRPDIQEAAAAGLLPAVSGLQIGKVDAFEEDPEKEFRARVILPGLGTQPGTLWARVASPDAGKDRGYFFRPEVDDEVVVGFLNEDPRQPVILGSLFGSKNAPPAELADGLDADNQRKGIVTRKGTIFKFVDDDKASFSIETANQNKILIDDDAETIQITDQRGNEVVLDKNGIQIKSAKDLTLEASGNVQIKGAKVDVK